MAHAQPNPTGRASWERVPGQDPPAEPPAEGEVFRRTVTAERFEDGSLKVGVAGRMLYGSQGRTVSATIEADPTDPDAEALRDLLDRMEGRYSRQLSRRLVRDGATATGIAIQEGEETAEEN